MPNDTQAAAATSMQATRKRWLAIVSGVFAALGLAYGAYWALALRYFQSTDDAYVSGNVVQITDEREASGRVADRVSPRFGPPSNFCLYCADYKHIISSVPTFRVGWSVSC